MEAHALVARSAAEVPFPFLCLLVSGGHNMLLVAHGVGDYTLMGSTLDDSVGECNCCLHRQMLLLCIFHADAHPLLVVSYKKMALHACLQCHTMRQLSELRHVRMGTQACSSLGLSSM